MKNFLDVQHSLAVNIHIRSIDQTEAIKMIKRKSPTLTKCVLRNRKKQYAAGTIWIYFRGYLTFGVDAKKLLEDLQSRNERMFLVTVLVMNTAKTRKELETRILRFLQPPSKRIVLYAD